MTTLENVKPSTLEKPVFIENSFVAPFFNQVVQDELKNAVEWLKEQKEIRQYVTYIGRSLYPLNTDFKGLLIEFLNESIQLNQNLTDRYGLYDRKDNINLRDAVNNCFVCNKKSANDFFHHYLRMFSLPKCYNEAFGRLLNKNEKAICEILYKIFCEWHGALLNYYFNNNLNGTI